MTDKTSIIDTMIAPLNSINNKREIIPKIMIVSANKFKTGII